MDMRAVLSLSVLIGAVAGCGGSEAGDGRAEVVVTTTILGDVVRAVAGDAVAVDVVLPLGADPHDFAASARQAEAMASADLLVVNGGDFEHGLDDVIESAADGGTPVFTFLDHARPLEDGDPHFWTDPTRMADAVDALVPELAELDGVDGEALEARAAEYLEQLDALDAEVEALLADVPDERRVLVTNHEVLGYFADRYDLEVVGAVIPSLTTSAAPSASDVDELAELIRDEGVPAIFAETTQSTDLAEALAEAVGRDVAVVELFSESLGEEGSGAETYLGLVRTDASRIARALLAQR